MAKQEKPKRSLEERCERLYRESFHRFVWRKEDWPTIMHAYLATKFLLLPHQEAIRMAPTIEVARECAENLERHNPYLVAPVKEQRYQMAKVFRAWKLQKRGTLRAAE